MACRARAGSTHPTVDAHRRNIHLTACVPRICYPRNVASLHTEPAELVIRPRSSLALSDLREVWHHRELLLMLGMRDVRVRYRQAVFGALWALIQPVSQAVIFTFLFHRMAGLRGDGNAPYPVFCLAGLVVWTLFSSGLSHASESLVQNSGLVTKAYFPRVILPLSSLMAPLVDFAISFVVLLGAMVIFKIPVSVSLIWALPVALLAALWAISVGIWTSAINVRFRDVRYALPFFIQSMLFLTPIFYSVPERWRRLFALNPMAVVEGFRAALFGAPLRSHSWRFRSARRWWWPRSASSTPGGWSNPSPTGYDARHLGERARQALPPGRHPRSLRLFARDAARSPDRRLSPSRRGRMVLGAARRQLRGRRRARWLGIIGRNGAGKIDAAQDPVARSPSRPRGACSMRGRVGSLLEVGTGFHPELTGRENIYLNGAILGMTRRGDRAQVRRDRRLRRDRDVSSTRRSSATRAACTCGWRSPSRRTWSPRS